MACHAHLEDLGEVRPRLDREVDPVEVRQRLEVRRIDAEDVLVRLLGLGDVAELVLERPGEALADGPLDRRIRVSAEDVGVGVGERLPAAVDRGREARRLFADLLVERELLERTDVDVERLYRIEELLLEELGEPVVRAEPLVLAARRERAAPRRRARASPTRRPRDRAARESRRLRPAFDLSAKSASSASNGGLVLGRGADDVAVRGDGGVRRCRASSAAACPSRYLSSRISSGDSATSASRARTCAELGPAFGLHVQPIEGADGR